MKDKNCQCDHIGLSTNNIKKLEKFYIEKLDFKKMKEEILPKSIMKKIFGISCACNFIRLINKNLIIELFEPISMHLRRRVNIICGLNHWGYVVEDRIRMLRKLKERKVKIITIKRNEHTVYFIADPDGNRIEIREHKK